MTTAAEGFGRGALVGFGIRDESLWSRRSPPVLAKALAVIYDRFSVWSEEAETPARAPT